MVLPFVFTKLYFLRERDAEEKEEVDGMADSSADQTSTSAVAADQTAAAAVAEPSVEDETASTAVAASSGDRNAAVDVEAPSESGAADKVSSHPDVAGEDPVTGDSSAAVLPDQSD